MLLKLFHKFGPTLAVLISWTENKSFFQLEYIDLISNRDSHAAIDFSFGKSNRSLFGYLNRFFFHQNASKIKNR